MAVVDVVIFSWANALSYPALRKRLGTIYYAIVRPEGRDSKLMIPVYDRVINNLEIGETVLNANKSALLDPGCLDGDLSAMVTLLGRMFWCQPLWLIVTMDEGEVLTWVTVACRRNICSGDGKYTHTVVERAMVVMQ